MLKANVGRFVAAFLSATLFSAVALAQVPQPTLPQPAQPQVTPTTPPGSHQLTPEDLDAFFDGLIPLQLQQDDIAGAVVLIVKDGNVLFARGYGFADADRKKPVTVDDTLFRPGSISKLFTWTAVMQLVEQGKLDLDRDINDYLDFKVPPAFGAPITLRNLMTHTPGFEEALKDLLAPDANHLMPLQTYLSTHMPNRIFPPGSVPAYSNYGTTLAGYIVQRVSGKPFEQYIQENIFAPLRMTHSTFAQPLPDALKPMMSAGFRLESEGAKPFELVQPVPAGALSASAGDIARFMIAHLQNGRFEDKQILKPETAQLMHSRQFGLDPQMNGMALGFYEESGNGHRIIGHGGDTMYFHSDLHLIPDANLGFFVSYNSEGRNDISPRGPLWQQFLDRYYPVPPVEIPHVATAVQDAKAASGSYISSRRSQTNVLRILSWLGVDQARPGPDGTVIVDSRKGLNGKPRRWYDTGSQLYQDRDGKRHIAFQGGWRQSDADADRFSRCGNAARALVPVKEIQLCGARRGAAGADCNFVVVADRGPGSCSLFGVVAALRRDQICAHGHQDRLPDRSVGRSRVAGICDLRVGTSFRLQQRLGFFHSYRPNFCLDWNRWAGLCRTSRRTRMVHAAISLVGANHRDAGGIGMPGLGVADRELEPTAQEPDVLRLRVSSALPA